MRSYEEKKELLSRILKEALSRGACLAFSGGADSSALLAALSGERERSGGILRAVRFDTFLHGAGDGEAAARTAKECKAELFVIPVNELDNPAILNNPKDRCYLCKKYLFEKLLDFAKAHGCRAVLDGTNADDGKAYRPGLRALSELGVISPLREAGFTKEEVRRLAAEYGLSAAKRPSDSCLATRLPYGSRLERETLERIRSGEEYLKSLGLRSVRLRLHGRVARIEVEEGQLSFLAENRYGIVKRLKELGFSYITLDLEGFRSGSMDI